MKLDTSVICGPDQPPIHADGKPNSDIVTPRARPVRRSTTFEVTLPLDLAVMTSGERLLEPLVRA
jgi:hypothetical protein